MLSMMLVSGAELAHAREPRSGYEYMNEDARVMQDDDFGNPGMLVVEEGRNWFARRADNGRSCSSCHGADGNQFDLARIAGFPRYSDELKRPITLQQQINRCWTERLDEFPMLYDAKVAIDLETFVRYLARGQVVAIRTDGPMAEHYEAGKALFHERLGQFEMTCAQCHERYAGKRLRGQILSEAQSNGFPLYRLNKGQITSLHQRFRQCAVSLRTEPLESGSSEYVDLEVYIAARGNGLRIETPAVRY